MINQKTAVLKMTKEIEKITVLFQIKSNPYLVAVFVFILRKHGDTFVD